jgi:hypothetical protein
MCCALFSFKPFCCKCCGIPCPNPGCISQTALSILTFGVYAIFITSCCIIPCAALDGNCFGCCGQTTGAPKHKTLWLEGGLKDEITAKETASKVNAVIKEYFSDGETLMHAAPEGVVAQPGSGI